MNKPSKQVVHWFRLFYELKMHGYSLYDLSIAVEIPKTTLQNYKSGIEPPHSSGEMIIAFWAHVTKNSPDSVHKIDRYSHRQ